MQGWGIGYRVALRPGKRRALPNTPEWRIDGLVETAKVQFRAKVVLFPCDQTAVWFSEDPAPRHAQELLKGEGPGATTNLYMVRDYARCH
jgi:hypothetical protein